MTTNAQHRAAAERLTAQAAVVYTQLQNVPVEGTRVPAPVDGYSARTIHKSQTERRDELGKQLMGIYALAQVHATLALGTEPKAELRSYPQGPLYMGPITKKQVQAARDAQAAREASNDES